MDIYDVIIRPIMSEKTYRQLELGKYSFEVHYRADKRKVKQAVEQIYDVDVDSVNVMNMPAKVSRSRYRPPWKKAIVTLAPGDRIEELEA